VWRVLVLTIVVGCGRLGFEPVTSGDGSPGDGNRFADADTRTSNVVFVTSTTTIPAHLGGLQGADAYCADRARAAGLPGTYVAWLSSSTVNARDRLGGASGWRRVDGTPFAATVADLVAGKIFYPVRLDEFGNLTTGSVLTGTNVDGTAYVSSGWNTCSDYTTDPGGQVAAGSPDGTTSAFTLSAGILCTLPVRLYCLSTDRQDVVAVTPSVGRRAFMASGYAPAASGGLPNADTYCQTAATNAGLTGGLFKALIATSTASAASRFNLGGAPWVRIDGARLAASPTAFMASDLETTLTQLADGTYSSDLVWTGHAATGGPSDVSTTSDDCVDWTSVLSTDFATMGSSSAAGPAFFNAVQQLRCSGTNGSASLYCLEQ
jgi:hypothetical protein